MGELPHGRGQCIYTHQTTENNQNHTKNEMMQKSRNLIWRDESWYFWTRILISMVLKVFKNCTKHPNSLKKMFSVSPRDSGAWGHAERRRMWMPCSESTRSLTCFTWGAAIQTNNTKTYHIKHIYIYIYLLIRICIYYFLVFYDVWGNEKLMSHGKIPYNIGFYQQIIKTPSLSLFIMCFGIIWCSLV